MKIFSILTVLYFLLNTTKDDLFVNQKQEPLVESKPVWYTIKATKYHAVPEQCWGDGTITASGHKIDFKMLSYYNHFIFAASHDLIKKWGYNTVIEIRGIGYVNNYWVLKDKMNKRFSNKIDLLFPVGDTIKFCSENLQYRIIDQTQFIKDTVKNIPMYDIDKI
jgi:3D (Asp-Asp-Asp) domain-containing protein